MFAVSAIVTVTLRKVCTVIDTTVGVENVTWYHDDMRDNRRIVVTFQDGLRKDHLGGAKTHGEIEFWGDSQVVPYSSMRVDSPEQLDELAKAIEVAAQHWRHCIEECGCFTEDGPLPPGMAHAPEEGGVKIISFGGMDIPGLWTPGEEDEEDIHEEEPQEDEGPPPDDDDDDDGYPPVG